VPFARSLAYPLLSPMDMAVPSYAPESAPAVAPPATGLDRPACLLTNDVETHSIWHNGLRDETGRKVLEEGMPILLDLYERYGVKSTFYFTGYIARKFPDVVRMVVPRGHEVACHG